MPKTLRGLGIAERIQGERVMGAWPAAAARLSSTLAANTRAVHFSHGVLSVGVARADLAGLLNAERATLLEALADEVGDGVITDLHIVNTGQSS